MGIAQLKQVEVQDILRTVIADLWATNRVGRNKVPHDTVKKALSCLSPDLLEDIVAKYYRQQQRGQIAIPSEYIKALILNAPIGGKISAMGKTGFTGIGTEAGDHTPNFDIEDYVRLSIQNLNGK